MAVTPRVKQLHGTRDAWHSTITYTNNTNTKPRILAATCPPSKTPPHHASAAKQQHPAPHHALRLADTPQPVHSYPHATQQYPPTPP